MPIFFFRELQANSCEFMWFHGFSWVFMGRHGPSWAFMGLHGSSWAFMGLQGSSGDIMWFFWFLKQKHSKNILVKKIWNGEFRFEFKNCKFCSQYFWEQIGPFSPEISKLKTGLSTSYFLKAPPVHSFEFETLQSRDFKTENWTVHSIFFERTLQSIVLNFKLSSPEISKLKTGLFTPYLFRDPPVHSFKF